MASLDDFFAKKDKRKKGKGKKFVTSETIAKTIEVSTTVKPLVLEHVCDVMCFFWPPLRLIRALSRLIKRSLQLIYQQHQHR